MKVNTKIKFEGHFFGFLKDTEKNLNNNILINMWMHSKPAVVHNIILPSQSTVILLFSPHNNEDCLKCIQPTYPHPHFPVSHPLLSPDSSITTQATEPLCTANTFTHSASWILILTIEHSPNPGTMHALALWSG